MLFGVPEPGLLESSSDVGGVCPQLTSYLSDWAHTVPVRLWLPTSPVSYGGEGEKEVEVPSAHALIRRCHWVWVVARRILTRNAARMKRLGGVQTGGANLDFLQASLRT